MIFTENIDYQLNHGKQELFGFDDKYLNIVDYILKITEEIWEDRAIWVIYDTYFENIPIYSGANIIHGIDEVVKGTLKTLSSFPDRKMKGEAVIWSKVGEQTFYSSHRIASTATNLGDTVFGKATGKKVFFRTIADCVVTENKIIEEWLVRDNLHLVQQLGFDPVEMAKRDQRYKNRETGKATYQAENLLENSNLDSLTSSSSAKLVFSLYEEVWENKNFEQLSTYYDHSATIHAICGEDLTDTHTTQKYLENLFASFPNADIHVERISCNEKEGVTEVAVRWKMVGKHSGDGFFGNPSGKEIMVLGITHYLIKNDKITEEWMIFDGFDVLCQIHS